MSWQLHVVVQGDGVVKRGTTTVCGANSTCDVSYVDGTSLALTATPNSGYTFLVWGGDCSGISTCNLTMDQDHSVTASFADVTPPGPPQIVSPASSDPPIQSTTGGSTNVAFNNGGDASTASFLCRVDIANAGLAQPCSSPWNTGNLSTGTHTVWLWAKDAAGNISSPASRSFKVVNLPDTTIGGTPIEGATTDSSTAFTYASPTGTSFACTLDGGAVPCSANVGPLPDGPHAWTVAAGISPFGDNVVYYDPSPAIRNFTVATASPGGGGGSGDAGAAGGPGGAGGTAGTGDTGGSVGTAGPGDSGGAGGAAGGGSTTTNPPAIAAKLARAFKTSKAGVTVTRLQLSGVTSGAALSITCKGKGCGFKSKKVTLKKGAAALQALFKKRTLKPGAVITVKLARAGMRGKLFTLTVKKHGQPALKIASV